MNKKENNKMENVYLENHCLVALTQELYDTMYAPVDEVKAILKNDYVVIPDDSYNYQSVNLINDEYIIMYQLSYYPLGEEEKEKFITMSVSIDLKSKQLKGVSIDVETSVLNLKRKGWTFNSIDKFIKFINKDKAK
jgi:hypothetical protein